MGILHLFPKSGFDQSTTTPVFIGVLLSWAFTEWFGWVFAGLVVPGYLAAVFLLDPRAATIDVIEATLTYALARALGEWLSQTGLTSRVFGRERFFLVVLASILVRLGVEGALLPRLVPHATWAFSIGLVVVPLAANACWKTGLARGAIQNGVPTALTYLILRFVLVPHTNLSLAGFELATENIAASFLASPKAYILLVTGALLAAAANLRFGWDFNGILVPALLALVAIEPVKFVATFAEVGVLLLVTSALLRATPLGRLNIEGPRKTVLFFTIDYALRFAFAALVGRVLPGSDVVDLMGFGYLLPTLLAVKAATKGSSALVLLPTAQVSLAAFALGSLVGFGASLFDRDDDRVARAAVTRGIASLPGDPAAAGLWLAALARPYESRAPHVAVASPRAVAALVDAIGSPANDPIARAHGFEVERLDHNVAVLRERFETAGGRLGESSVLVATTPGAERGAIALVPEPIAAPEIAALAGELVAEGLLDAVVIAGVEPAAGEDRAPQASAKALAHALLRDPKGFVIGIRRAAGSDGALHGVREDSPRLGRLLTAFKERGMVTPVPSGETQGDEDVALDLSSTALESWLDARAPRSDAIALSSSTAIALAVDGLTASGTIPPLEARLALRQLLLEPLLGAKGARSLASLRFAAGTLSYRLHGPAPLADGSDGVALLPEGPQGSIAIIARASGVKDAVVALPQGDKEGPRDLALRLSVALGADALLLGLEPGGAGLNGATFRVAHDLATMPDEGRRPTALLLREGDVSDADVGAVALGAWGGAGREEATARVTKALISVGVATTEGPLDDATRDFCARSLFGDSVLVGLVADPRALRASSLDAARRAVRTFAGTKIAPFDGAVADVAARLVASLPAHAVSPASVDLLSLVRRAALEESVTARRQLVAALETTATRAALARAAEDEYLVVVRRDARGTTIAASTTDPRGAEPDPRVVVVGTIGQCARPLAAGGVCRVEPAR